MELNAYLNFYNSFMFDINIKCSISSMKKLVCVAFILCSSNMSCFSEIHNQLVLKNLNIFAYLISYK